MGLRKERFEVNAMEIRARYVQVGAFVLATIFAGFVFVYWLNNASGLRDRMLYRVRFQAPVAGLLGGSAVLFNGIRVGEVTGLQLNQRDPREVTVMIAIEPATPVRADTKIDIDFQGLAGAPVIALKGGDPASPAVTAEKGEPPLLVAEPTAGQSLSQAARDALRRLNGIMAENAEPLQTTIANLSTFSAALARNSDKLDGIVAGLERMTGGGAGKAATIFYDLTAPRDFPPAAKVHPVQLVVPEPTALVMIDAQTILIRPPPATDGTSKAGLWGDSLPKLVQAKLIETFDNANYLRAVGRPTEGFEGDHKLLIDIRTFQLTLKPQPTAEIDLAAKVLNSKGGVVGARVFRATAPATAADVAAAAAALDVAFGKVARELVIWTAGAL
jgi:phospholipid/cholesterol/gamma-HCH transport system substrate-binding protein